MFSFCFSLFLICFSFIIIYFIFLFVIFLFVIFFVIYYCIFYIFLLLFILFFRRTQNNSDFADRAIEMMCMWSNGSFEATGFPTRPCDMIRAEVYFPSCWDGVNIDSPDHQSHVCIVWLESHIYLFSSFFFSSVFYRRLFSLLFFFHQQLGCLSIHETHAFN
jgi:Domain of unknown function (DUF1996)